MAKTLAEVRTIVGDEEFEEDMIAFATTASSPEIRLRAEIALRKMHPSCSSAVPATEEGREWKCGYVENIGCERDDCRDCMSAIWRRKVYEKNG